jgi:hypothetical protein
MNHPDVPFAVVVWGDAHMSSDDVSQYDINHAPTKLNTYGWLLRSDPVGISIAGEWSESDRTYRSTTFIPRPMVIEEVLLNLVRKPKKRDRTVVDPSGDLRVGIDLRPATNGEPPL